jgi:hypothetical protein
MNHVLLGAGIPFLLAACLYAIRRGRAGLPMLVLTPLAMAAGALWAVAPDLPRLVGLQGLYQRLAQDPRMNVCFWHYHLDRVETDSSWPAAGLLLMAVALIAAAWRQLRREEGR